MAAEEIQASEDAHGVHQHVLEVVAAVDAHLLAAGLHLDVGHPHVEGVGREVHGGHHLDVPHVDHHVGLEVLDGGPHLVDLLPDVHLLVEEGSIPAHPLLHLLRVNEFSNNELEKRLSKNDFRKNDFRFMMKLFVFLMPFWELRRNIPMMFDR